MASKEIELPDGSVAEFPDTMDDSQIEDVLRRQFGSQGDVFPGMPQGFRNRGPDFSTFEKPDSSFADLTRDVTPELPPPPLLRGSGQIPQKPIGPDDPAFYGDPNSIENIRQAGEFRGTSEAAGPSLAILGGGAGAGLLGGVGATAATVGRAGAGYVAGEALEKGLGLPPWVGEVASLATGTPLGGKALKAGVKALVKKPIAEAVEEAVKQAATKKAVGSAITPEAAWFAKYGKAAKEGKALAGQTKIPSVFTKGPTKAGPPPTPPDELEAALRASLTKGKTGLAAERLRVGAEKAGGRKGPLMTALAREEAGPVLGEMRGTASPVIPEKAIADMAAALRKLPKGGPERLAYVERATSGKAKTTAETIRRALESMGLLVPIGIAGTEWNDGLP